MYRQIQNVREKMVELQDRTRSAILAEDTREASAHAGAAQMIANQLGLDLEGALTGRDGGEEHTFGEPKVERPFVIAARRSLDRAVTDGERVGMGTNISEVRSALIMFKTHVDFADAYIRAALGGEES